jgi:hypothetical protein
MKTPPIGDSATYLNTEHRFLHLFDICVSF